MSLTIASILMILLGTVRFAGGALLLALGRSSSPQIRASDGAIAAVGVFLLAIGVAEAAAGVGVMLLRRRFWVLGIVTTIAFVIDGAVNGTILFGSPGVAGTVSNVIVASAILILLYSGRGALDTVESPTGR